MSRADFDAAVQRRAAGAPRERDEVVLSHALSRGVEGMSVDEQQLALRGARFAVAPDTARVDQEIAQSRKASFAHVPSTSLVVRSPHLKWARPRDTRVGCNLFGGRRRAGDLQSLAEADGEACVTLDWRATGAGKIDLNDAGARAAVRAGAASYDWLHASFECFSFSSALSLPPGDAPERPPVGPYREPAHPDGKPTLPQHVAVRVSNSTQHMMLAVDVAYVVHDRGGTVSLENSPDCRDPQSLWHRSMGGYSTATQFPAWAHPYMAKYIAHSQSTVHTVPLCAGGPHDDGSLFLNYKAFCLNPAARARASAILGFVCTHSQHTHMAGRADSGQMRGRVAEEYTASTSAAIYDMHRSQDAAGRKKAGGAAVPVADDGASKEGACAPPSVPAVAPPNAAVNSGAPATPKPQAAAGARRTVSFASTVYLVLVLASTLAVGVLPDGSVAKTVITVAANAAGRGVAMQAARGMLPMYGLAEAQAPLLVAGAVPNGRALDYVIAALGDDVHSATVVPFSDVADDATRAYISLAIASVEQLIGREYDTARPLPRDYILGHAAPDAVAAPISPTDDGTQLYNQRNVHDASHIDRVRRALDEEARRQAAAGDADMAQYLCETRDAVLATPQHVVQPGVAAASRPTDAWMATCAYHTARPPRTDPLPSPQPQPAVPASFCPRTRRDLHRPGFLEELDDWFSRAVAWMMAVVRGEHPLPERPEVFVRSWRAVAVPEAAQHVWDMRREAEGIVEPLDFAARPETPWNTEWLREEWRDYADQEAVSHACDGADLKPRLALQYCFCPHLLTIADGYDEVYRDLCELQRTGYYAWFARTPTCPCRCNGQGTRPKGDGFRRIASGSCPYDVVIDERGDPCYSINADARRLAPMPPVTRARQHWRTALAAIVFLLLVFGRITGRGDTFGERSRRRFRKERKPRFSQAMHNTAVLRAIGDRCGLPVYYFVDDFKHFFYQVRLRTACLWFAAIFMLDPDTLTVGFFLELVLAMGYTPCSNIAQMICDGFLYIFGRHLDDATQHIDADNAELRQMMAARRAQHGHASGRPFASLGYTDDCWHVVLGVLRYVCSVVVWRRLLRQANVEGAKASKRQGGTWVIFLGGGLLATALLAYMPEHKLVRALEGLVRLLRRELSKELARKLFGLLVHMSFLSAHGRASTAGLWRCLAEHRADPVWLYEREEAKVRAWVHTLQNATAAPMDVLLRRHYRARAPPVGAAVSTGQSDAFRASPRDEAPPTEQSTVALASAGCGGYAHGNLWHADVTGALAREAIGCLELLAFFLHLVMNVDAHALVSRVEHFVDNMNAYLAVTRESAKAVFMQWLYDLIVSTDVFRRVAHKLRVGQRWGAWLLLGDAASRNYRHTVAVVGERMRISMRWLELTDDAQHYLAQAHHAAERIALDKHPAPVAPPRQRAGGRGARPRGARAVVMALTLLLAAGGAMPVGHAAPEGHAGDGGGVGGGAAFYHSSAAALAAAAALMVLAVWLVLPADQYEGGWKVMLHGLVNAAHLNGRTAYVNRRVRSRGGRVDVVVEDIAARARVRPQNLSIIDTRVAPAVNMRTYLRYMGPAAHAGPVDRSTRQSVNMAPIESARRHALEANDDVYATAVANATLDHLNSLTTTEWLDYRFTPHPGMTPRRLRETLGPRVRPDLLPHSSPPPAPPPPPTMAEIQAMLAATGMDGPRETEEQMAARRGWTFGGAEDAPVEPELPQSSLASMVASALEAIEGGGAPSPPTSPPTSGAVRRARAPPASVLRAVAVVQRRARGQHLAGTRPRASAVHAVAQPMRAPPTAPQLPPPARRRLKMRARHAAVAHALSNLEDDSPYALRPADAREYTELMREVDETIDSGVNDSTARGERSAWEKYYKPYCRMLRTAVWRGVEAATAPMREGAFAAGLAQYVWRHMQPRRRTDPAPRVASVRNVLSHVRRRHERRGMLFSDNKVVAHLLRGLVRRRLAAHGVALPVRAEPFTAAENLAMLELRDGEQIGRREYAHSSRFWRGWRCVNTFADQAGPRKAEVVGTPDIGFTRDDVHFVASGVHLADPSAEQLAAMVSGRDRVTVRVGPSKADADGTIFGPNLITSLYNTDNPMSFAAAIVDYELAFPCRGRERARTWLFTPDGSARWSGAAIDRTLADVMAAKLTAAQRVQKTFHSKRVWVATALKGLPQPSSDGEVQAFVRWSSVESLRVYARLNHDYQARRRDDLVRASVDAVNATALPCIDEVEDAAYVQQLAEGLDEDAT